MVAEARGREQVLSMKKVCRLIWYLICDNLRWCFFSSSLPLNKKKNTERKIKLLIHSIEKGLSLKEVKAGFGKDKIIALKKNITIYEQIQGEQDYLVIQAKTIINEYIQYHEQHNYNVAEYAQKYIIDDKEIQRISTPGTEERTNYDIDSLSIFSYEDLIRQRHSTRNFSVQKLDYDKVLQAIDIARETAPSACNRQSVKVYFVKNTELVQKILKIQGANRGFGEAAQSVLIISTDLTMYAGLEKKLPFIDSGIFLITLANTLFYKGIANCMLHACIGAQAEGKIRKMCNIPYYETVAGFIALGSYEAYYQIAKSPKKPLEEICHEI